MEKNFKRYEASLSSKTCDAMVNIFLELSCKSLVHFLPVNRKRLLGDLNENFMVKKEPSIIARRLSLSYGRYMQLERACKELDKKNLIKNGK